VDRVPLNRIVRDEVAPFAGEARVRIEAGEDAVLPAKTAVDLSLLVHELATNAAKYGAWSNERGRVEIAWRVEGPPGRRVLALDWRERGGPPVSPPRRRGFGTTLIGSALRDADANVDLRHEPEGVTCAIRLPLRPAAEPPAEDAAAADAGPAGGRGAAGLRVFLAEDEPLVRLDLETMLEALGAEVVASASSFPEAQALSEGLDFDAAVLDLNLNGLSSAPLAEALAARAVAVVFFTGYRDLQTLPPSLTNRPFLNKPLQQDALAAALAAAKDAAA
jgi:CheY-like chemotaxis protein